MTFVDIAQRQLKFYVQLGLVFVFARFTCEIAKAQSFAADVRLIMVIFFCFFLVTSVFHWLLSRTP